MIYEMDLVNEEIIEKAWETFELKEVCLKLGLKPNCNGELVRC